MTKFRKKPVVIDATQWHKNGDHPLDYAKNQEGFAEGRLVTFSAAYCASQKWEGQVVRYYRTPDCNGQNACKHCAEVMHKHGWIETLEGGHIVCPGDWIITGVKGELYPCRADIFAMTYEEVSDA